ncbi:MAG: anthranilate synthase component I family protein [Bacteroidota bacterium]
MRLAYKEQKIFGDTHTPVSLFLKLRDQFSNCILLENSDYSVKENHLSFICCQSIASFKLDGEGLEIKKLNKVESRDIESHEVLNQLHAFNASFDLDEQGKYPHAGLFGYTSFDAAQHFMQLNYETPRADDSIPEMLYHVYQLVIAINHFNNEIVLQENLPEGQPSLMDKAKALIKSERSSSFQFQLVGEEKVNGSDEDYLNNVQKAIDHCFRGDVFQLVLSRRFSQEYKGDEFNLYRALRMINPSPYSFYFDYGNFKIFGSSPEANLVVQNSKAEIHPIAGTYKRTSDDAKDLELAQALFQDEKENAEHTMLVDLARNDLSTVAEEVKVEKLKEVQFFSHVIHLVSKVVGKVKAKEEALQLLAGTFPAGTLSGAPKHKALQLIDRYENERREFYGGAIGFIGFNGDSNQAIIIRSFMAKKNKLFYQAGAGIVSESVPEKELQEVNNKIAALRKALKIAEEI